MRICDSCGCPAHDARSTCGWCDAALAGDAPVSFVLHRSPQKFSWYNDGTFVAEAVLVHGVWKIQDSRGRQLVTLMPVAASADADDDGRAELALVGPTARVIGTIDRGDDERGRSDATARDESGRGVLVMRGDGPNGGHMVDRSGEIVAIASWDDASAGDTDLLVTGHGTRQPLSFVFGLLLVIELDRQAGRPA